MNQKRQLITFDWATKRLLRGEANFGILEGFLSELLTEEITILDVLESESNKVLVVVWHYFFYASWKYTKAESITFIAVDKFSDC